MKRIFIPMLVFASLSSLQAQVSIRPTVGFNNTRFVTVSGNKYVKHDRFDFVPDFRLGAIADVPLGGQLSFQPGLMIARNSENRNGSFFASNTTGFGMSFLEVPLTLVAHGGKGSNGGILVGAGLYGSIFLSGSYRARVYTAGVYQGIEKVPIKAGDRLQDINPVGVGVRGELGYEWPRGLALRGYAQRLVTDMSPNVGLNAESTTYFNYGIGASLALEKMGGKKAAAKREAKAERKKKLVRDAPRFNKNK
ncbi:MAG: outer membrane beta-barrel protein [Flavipsychrobacter sp.]|nr:outer membrane beta-barrel protein [Flavipsychrobacter sp.]